MVHGKKVLNSSSWFYPLVRYTGTVYALYDLCETLLILLIATGNKLLYNSASVGITSCNGKS